MSQRNPWQTKEWRERRAEFVKGKSCAWCGSREKLTVSHDRKGFNPRRERYQVESRYFHDYFNNGQHMDEFNQLKEQARTGVQLYYYDSCPSCGYGSVYSRSDKYCRENKAPRFKCSRCKTEFQESVKMVKRSSQTYLKKRFFSLFRDRHREELTQLYTAHMEKLAEDYFNFKDTTILCGRCHYAYHKGLTLCPACRTRYKKRSYEMCWECFTKTEEGKRVLERRQEEAEAAKPVPYTHPWCGKTFMIEKRWWETEANPGMCCIERCPNDVNYCETAAKH